MTWTESIDWLAIALFMGLLLWAAISDFRDYTIPNVIPLAMAGVYPIHVAAAAGPVDWAGGLVTALIVFAVGATFFVLRLTGGGDVKLLSAMALWAGPGLIVPSLILTGITGGVLGLAMLTWLRVYRPRRYAVIGEGARHIAPAKQTLPYGVAIAAGGLFLGTTLLAG